MCRKNVILFDCGHTRKLNITPCNDAGVECAVPERILIPEGGGIGIEAPKHKTQWTCAFKCVPGRASHEPLIDLAKENADAVKAEIDHKIEVLSVLSTPFGTPASEKGGFSFVKSPAIERGGFNFDQRFVKSVTRRLQSATPSPGARETTTFNFKLTMPGDKVKDNTTNKLEAQAPAFAQIQSESPVPLPSASASDME